MARFASNRRALEEIIELSREIRHNGTTYNENPVFRRKLATLWTANESGRMIGYQVGWMQSQGLVPNKEASVSKLMGSEIAQKINQLGMELLGMYGILDKGSKWAYLDGRISQEWVDSISFTIRAGTSEIQRNIIASRGLGLPRA